MKYRVKPAIVEAIQWTGENIEEVKEFCGEFFSCEFDGICAVHSPWGRYFAATGDYIVKNENNEFHAYSADVFDRDFEEFVRP